MNVEVMKKHYPGVDLAYDLAVNSYDSLVKRFDSIDGRLQTIMGLAATTMAIVPSVAAARNISFRSCWFWLAFLTLVAIIAVGSYARHYGEIKVINPMELYNFNTWLGWEPWEFKSKFIYWAGEHFLLNNGLLTWKWKRSVAITIGFFFQVAFLVAWVVAARL